MSKTNEQRHDGTELNPAELELVAGGSAATANVVGVIEKTGNSVFGCSQENA